jgi:hypothetical protein
MQHLNGLVVGQFEFRFMLNTFLFTAEKDPRSGCAELGQRANRNSAALLCGSPAPPFSAVKNSI